MSHLFSEFNMSRSTVDVVLVSEVQCPQWVRHIFVLLFSTIIVYLLRLRSEWNVQYIKVFSKQLGP